MRTPRTGQKSGFVALTSAIIIGLLLITVTLSLNLTGFFARFNVLGSEYKERSSSLAEACVDAAILEFAADSGYVGGETIDVDGLNCEIISVLENSGEVTIKTTAEFPQVGAERTVTNLVVVILGANLSIISWEEVASHI